MKHKHYQRLTSGLFGVAGHLTGVLLVSVALTVLMMPPAFAVQVGRITFSTPDLLEMSAPMFLIHVALSGCIWAMGWITFTYVRERRRELALEGRRAVRLSHGSVMTETLVVLPVWMLLTFGLSQMVINNIAGALANVAVYEAGRAAWIWKPEAGVRAGVTEEQALDRARIAAAMVMTPVAAGDFFSTAGMDGDAGKMREALMLTHVPFLGGSLPGGGADILAALSFLDPMATRGNQSVMRALDVSPFIVRTVKKFTHAYAATSVAFSEADGRTGVTLTYKHFIAMPMMGPIFSASNFDSVGTRLGYYAEFTRTYGFKTQLNMPNPALPTTNFIRGAEPSANTEGAVRSGVGW